MNDDTSDPAKTEGHEIQSMGGKARAEKLSPAERRQIAYRAAEARWGGQLPRATHDGLLRIGSIEMECAVLNTGKRVLPQATVMESIGRTGRPKTPTGPDESSSFGLPPFLAATNLKPFITDELRDATTPILYRTKNAKKAFGFDARIIPMTCEVYLKARDAGAVTRKNQKVIVKTCDLLMRGLAHVGIIALVDEATGYQDDRARDDLAKILEAYIAPHFAKWTRRFPHEFRRQVYRLHNWEYKPDDTRTPRYVGKFIMKYIYSGLPDVAVQELKTRNPNNEKGQRVRKLFQLLTDETGIPHLDLQIATVTTLMRASSDKEQFVELHARAFAKEFQPRLPFKMLPKPDAD